MLRFSVVTLSLVLIAGTAHANHNVTTQVVPNPCNGDATATATAVVTGGSGNFSYQWSTVPSQTTQTATDLLAGTYLVVVTDLINGDQVPAFAVITDPPPIVIFFSTTPPLCNGGTGNIDASIAGGTPGYTYSWSNGAMTEDIMNVAAGAYTLTVTDTNNCQISQQTNLMQPMPVVANGTKMNTSSCFAPCDGVAMVAPSGGTGGYSVTWSPGGAMTTSISGLCVGNFHADITDGNNCPATYDASIAGPTLSAPVVSALPSPIFVGDTLNLSAVDVPGATFVWSGPTNFSSMLREPMVANVSAANTGNYSATYSIAGCSSAPGTVAVEVMTPDMAMFIDMAVTQDMAITPDMALPTDLSMTMPIDSGTTDLPAAADMKAKFDLNASVTDLGAHDALSEADLAEPIFLVRNSCGGCSVNSADAPYNFALIALVLAFVRRRMPRRRLP